MKTAKAASWWSVFACVPAFSVAVFLTVAIQNKIARAKQATLYRAEASLLAALNDAQGKDFHAAKIPRQYGCFDVLPCDIRFAVENHAYHCVFMTEPEYQFRNRGTLAVTAKRVFIWLDYRHGPKIIPAGYEVPRWRAGF